MDRRWVSTIFWTLLFALGVYFSSRVTPTQQPYPLGRLLGLQSLQEIEKQTHYSKEEIVRKASATPQATETPMSTHPQELLAMLRDDRLCDFVRTPHDRMLLLQALLEHARSPLLTQLFGPNGPLSGNPNFDAADEPGVFYNALLYSGLIDGVKPPPPDYAYAEKLFRDLENRDPDNGAYYYFHAYAASKAGRSPKDQHVLLLKAIETVKFNTFLPQIAAEFKSGGSINPTLWIATIEAMNSIPIPSYPSPKFVNQLLQNDPQPIQEHAVTFGFVLMEHPRAIKLEKAVGMQIVVGAWDKAYPREKIPNLKKKLEEKRDQRKERIFEKAKAALNRPECDRRLLDEYFSAFRDDAYPF